MPLFYRESLIKLLFTESYEYPNWTGTYDTGSIVYPIFTGSYIFLESYESGSWT